MKVLPRKYEVHKPSKSEYKFAFEQMKVDNKWLKI